jgi:hypothetical protein
MNDNLGAALFLPWKVICSDIFLGACFEILGWSALFISIKVIIEAPELLSYIQGTLIRIGEVCLIFYALLNCILIMVSNHFLTRYLQRLLLITIILSLLMSVQIVEPMFNTGLTWGYWLTCIGLLSCLLLEISETIHLKPTESA